MREDCSTRVAKPDVLADAITRVALRDPHVDTQASRCPEGRQTLPLALTRQVSPSIARCELTYIPRTAISLEVARAQHLAYERALAELGCEVVSLPAEPDLPDSVFVEDTALVLDEIALILRPGAEARQPETPSVAKVLALYRELAMVGAPGAVDGGDVLRVGKTIYVGCSGRTNAVGIAQVAAVVGPFGYRVKSVPVSGCLHLKSAVSQVGPETLLVNRRWIDAGAFEGLQCVDVHPDEPHAANALLIGDAVVYPASYGRSRERLEEHGIVVKTVDVSELQKAEGGVTCCSLIFESAAVTG
jgi:dimethylargininase